MKILFESDHAGFELKKELLLYAEELGYTIEDMGPSAFDEGDDYPDFIKRVAKKIAQKPEENRGVVIGGSGQGEAMTANRFPHVRAAVFYGPALPQNPIDIDGKTSTDPFENVRLSRIHNDANVLSIGARFADKETAKKAMRIWLETQFYGEERHARRINKIDS